VIDELLPYYNRELAFIRQLGAEFADAYPKIAGRLRLGPEGSEDPHVARLIEAFAFLNARTRYKLEDEFPEVSEALLGVLYPHFITPIPSMTVVQFALATSQTELTAGFTIPAHTALETESIQQEPCRFSTSYSVTVWPIRVEEARFTGPPFLITPVVRRPRNAASVLHLVLESRSPTVMFADLPINSLRFYLKAQVQHVYLLHELLLGHAIAVVVADSASDPNPDVLPPSCLQPVGFGLDEGVLPFTPRSPIGYRLLTEFFAFPNKFLFVDLKGLESVLARRRGGRLEISIFLNRESPELEQNLTGDNFRLGCTPAVNLFRQRAEPIRISHTEAEYPVIPDARRPFAAEVYSIDRVSATSPDGTVAEYTPVYADRYQQASQPHRFWHATRRPTSKRGHQGTEVFLTLVDLDLRPSAPADWTLSVETTSFNGNLPARLPFGGDQPRLFLTEGGGPLAPVVCLTPPTQTLRRSSRRGLMWQLISHLSLNHLSLGGAEPGAPALTDILRLYDLVESKETAAIISGLVSVSSNHTTARIRCGRRSAITLGVALTVLLDRDRFPGGSVYLFGSVLERFLALSCSINSFTQLAVTTIQREGACYQWPPRSGETALV
jgi:type VI secretion system protein ImpG